MNLLLELIPIKFIMKLWIAFEKGDYFFAEKKFSEAELNFENQNLLQNQQLWHLTVCMV